MAYVFLFGLLGFFCYDIMRVYTVLQKEQFNEIFFCGINGLVVRLLAYVAAGIIGAIASIDIFILNSTKLFGELEVGLTGAYVRAFALGVAGPASLSHWNTKAGLEGDTGQPASQESNQQMVDSLDNETDEQMSGSRTDMLFAFRRLLLR